MNGQHGTRIVGRRGFGNVLIVKVLFNQTNRLSLLVDTGAATTAITPQAATTLGLDPNKPSRWMDIISVHQIEKVPLIEVASVQIGGHQVEKVAVTILSLPTTMKIDGLLEVNVLRRFRATFEFDQATLILRQP